MRWDLLHQTQDQQVTTYRWEEQRGWYYKVEFEFPDMPRSSHTVYVEDPLHASRNANFEWFKHSQTEWRAPVNGGALYRSRMGDNIKLKFIAGDAH